MKKLILLLFIIVSLQGCIVIDPLLTYNYSYYRQQNYRINYLYYKRNINNHYHEQKSKKTKYPRNSQRNSIH